MSFCHSFPAVVDENARTLILGSMPGRASLDVNQYYAHPRNAFWRIMGVLFGADPELPYTRRLQILQQHQIALWDVMKSCDRPGSLDSAINESSIEANDFAGLFTRYPNIDAVFFNGAKAEQSFNKYVITELAAGLLPSIRIRLPSTSPAHASIDFKAKLILWEKIVR